MTTAESNTEPPDPCNRRAVIIDYTNHRGERSRRRVIPSSIFFSFCLFRDGEEWFLEGHDFEKGCLRTFAMKGIHSWEMEKKPRS